MENLKEHVEKTLELLKEGDELINVLPGTDRVLFVGNTGAGKSTLIQFIAGDNNSLISKEITRGDFVIEDGNRISNSTFLSHTILPELIFDNEMNTYFYDCPGFSDTRSTCHDIASTYFLKKLVDSGGRVKIVLTVNYSSVRRRVDRQDFFTVIQHVAKFIRNVTRYRDGIALVVTKVDNLPLRKGSVYVLVPDDEIIDGIATFLTEFKQHITTVNAVDCNSRENVTDLIDALLVNDNGKYTRIAIFRRPDESGPLTKIQLLKEGKSVIKTMIQDNIHFVDIHEGDFGFTVSEKSRNIINDLKEAINQCITNSMHNIVQELKMYYQDKEEELKDVREFVNEIDESIVCLTAMYTAISELRNPKRLVSIITQTLSSLQATIKMDDIYITEQYINYLSFMQNIVTQQLAVTPTEWGYTIRSIKDQLKETKNWYVFLTSLHKKLLWLGVPRNMEYPLSESQRINGNHYSVSSFFSAIENYGIDELNTVRHVSVNETKLKALNEVIDSSTELQLKEVRDGDSLVVFGGVVRLSTLTIPETLKSIEIFASDTVVIDEDIMRIGQEQDVCIMAPQWDIKGVRKIVLDGKEGQMHEKQKAENGSSPGEGGKDGIPGLPGGNAGNFLGIGKVFINGENLTISTQGGKGGKGQAGGDGADGSNGRNVDDSDVRRCNSFKEMHDNGFIYERKDGSIFVNYVYRKDGEDGNSGGNGGNGGRGGFGGNAGENIIFTIDEDSNIHHRSEQGDEGDYGECGKGGRGGWSGKGLRVWVNYTWADPYDPVGRTFLVLNMTETLSSTGRASSGKDGVLNSTGNVGTLPPTNVPFQTKSKIINEFKRFLFSMIHDKVTRNYVSQFMKEIGSNQAIQRSYNALGFADELEIIETVFNKTSDSSDAIPFYESLLERLKDFSEQTELAQTYEERKVLSHLYIGVLSKMYALKSGSEHSFVVNISGFLNATLDHVRDFQLTSREEFVNRLREHHKQKIDATVDEARDYINSEIVPEIEDLNNESDKNIEKIIEEVLTLQKQAVKERERMTEMEKKLEEELHLRLAFGVMKCLGEALRFYGNVGSVMCVIMERVESFVLQSEDNHIDITQMPQGVRSLLQNAKDVVTKYRHLRIEALQEQLSKLSDNVSRHSRHLGDLRAPVENLRDRLNTASTNDAVDIDDVTEIEQELQRDLRNKIRSIDGNARTAINILENALKALSVLDVCVGVYQNYKNDKAKLDQISNAIGQTQDKIDQLKDYENQIHDFLTPMVKVVQNYLCNVQNSLPAMSKIFLSKTKRKVQKILKDMKLKICEFTKGFRVHENFSCCFDKLDETISTLIGMYDHIQSYSEHKQFADYIADINSQRFSSMEIGNVELREALFKVNKLITFNILLSEYERFVAAFKQWVFPFAEYYLRDFSLPSTLASSDNLDSQTGNIQRQLEFLKQKLEEYNSSIISGIDDNIHHQEFNSSQEVTEPFFVWKNEKYKASISKLLSGEAVTLKADILSGVKKSSLKFRLIEINLKCPSTKLQNELNAILEHFVVTLKHHGNSYYQCGRKFYVIRSECQTVKYSFAKSQNGEPVMQNAVYEKIRNGDFMLSPYAVWTIQLARARGKDFMNLKNYKNCVDLELVGKGRYVKEENSISEINLQHYYETDDSISVVNTIRISQ
ncbi:uncharacterized protein [Periplaneta americana]|uniref:uncharacterized protein n=1 Tax=Periplaneta americana TaxID=6978 RepID=UPI0037E73BA4